MTLSSHHLVLFAIIVATIAGDIALKVASSRTDVLNGHLVAGVFLYALPAIGWMFLMKSQSLAQIAVIYSASTILILFGLSLFVFRETVTAREYVGAAFALAAVIAYQH